MNWSLVLDKYTGRRIAYVRFKTPRARVIRLDMLKVPLRSRFFELPDFGRSDAFPWEWTRKWRVS